MITMKEFFENIAKMQNNAHELTVRISSLAFFEDATIWDQDAQVLINLFEQTKETLNEYLDVEKENFNSVKTTREKLPFLKKVTANKDVEKNHLQVIKALEKTAISIDSSIENLFDLIDRTPNSQSEQKEMLSELKILKKELSVEKKEANEAVRLINAEARRTRSKVAGIRGSGIIGTVARYQRISARYEQESALRPQENTKATLERQLINLEKRINWISRFSGAGGKEFAIEPEKVLRCVYCGRRVDEGNPCKGCGSDITTLALN